MAGRPGGWVVVVGGDGSVHEVLNGLLPSPTRRRLGVVPAGTGNDIAGNLGIDHNPQEAAARIDPARGKRVDVGRAWFPTPDGGERVRFFLNSISTGVSARANRLAARMRRAIPGAVRYPLSGLAALFLEGPGRYQVRGEEEGGGRVLHSGPALNITLANGPCFGGGLRISPHSDPSDGALDLVVIGRLGRFRALGALARLRQGTHVGMRGVAVTRVRGPVEIRREGQEPSGGGDHRASGLMRLEADGENFEALGEIRVELLAGGLEVLGGPGGGAG